MTGPSSSASTVSQKCRVSIGETSGRGGLRWPWLVSGLQLSPSALGCRAGQRDGVVGEIQRRRTTPPRLGRRRGVAAARRLAQASGQLSLKAETAGSFEHELAVLGWRFWGAREAWGRVGGLCEGSGFLGRGRGGRGGPGDFFAVVICRRGVGAFRVSRRSSPWNRLRSPRSSLPRSPRGADRRLRSRGLHFDHVIF